MGASALAEPGSAALKAWTLRMEVEDFLVREARLLDEWRLDEWTKLLAEDVRYLVPPLDLPDADHRDTLFLISDNRASVLSRARQLMGRATWAESPRSRTRRLISNIEVLGQQGDETLASANFAIWTFQNDRANTYVGRYRHRLVRDSDGGFLFRERRTLLDLESLRPHSKLSVII